MPRIHPDQDILTVIRPTLADERRVVTSAEHAEKHGLKNATGNNEQKIGAHLLRLEKLFSQGSEVSDRIWKSAYNELLISAEAIESMDDGGEAFWRYEKQFMRDLGRGAEELDKEQIIQWCQDTQGRSLEPWKDYFTGEGQVLPLWFKFYAWDGMSSMGLIDRRNKTFMKRSSATTASYPPFDKEALEMVFRAILEQTNSDRKLSPTGFNKLYSQALFKVKGVLSTPDSPSEIDGEWIEYSSANKEDLISAATVTPWCIALKRWADSYLRDNTFSLFHLRDRATGKLSPTACASIRMEKYGSEIYGTRVREVSGLLGGATA